MGKEDPSTDPFEPHYEEETPIPYERSGEFQLALDSFDYKRLEELHADGLAQLLELQSEVNDTIRVAIAEEVMKVLGRMLTKDEREDLREWFGSETRWPIVVGES